MNIVGGAICVTFERPVPSQQPLVVTIGDPAGIGAEVILKAWTFLAASGPAFAVIGDVEVLASRARLTGMSAPIAACEPGEAAGVFSRALPVIPIANRLDATPGKPTPANAAGIVEAIDRAAELVASGEASAMVTAPIAKKPLYEAGFGFPGHTEYLGHLSARLFGRDARPVMMIAGPELRAVPVTIHVPLADVPRLLTTEDIVATARIVHDDLVAHFGIERPRLALAGLNPHAGEGGSMGREDMEIVAPAVQRLRAHGIDARGPLPADTMFHAQARRGYDAAICMYHDQALIPAKALAFDDAVNVTLGLPFIRTSPDHGTAFDIAGTGVARADSMIAAIRMAAAMVAATAGAK